MGKLVKLILFTIPIACSIASAGDFYVPYREILPGSDQYSCVDPLMDDQGDLSGFVFCDPAQSNVIVSRGYGTDVLSFEFEIPPWKSIHRFSPDRDTLYLYVLGMDTSWDLRLQISLLTITEDSHKTEMITPAIYSYLGTPDVQQARLSFSEGDSQAGDLLFEISVDYVFNIYGQGTERQRRSTSIMYPLDLSDELIKKRAAALCIAGTDSRGEPAQVWYDEQLYAWDYSAFAGSPDSGAETSTVLAAGDDMGNSFVQKISWGGSVNSLAAVELDPDIPGREFIVAADAEDLLESLATARPHLAAYGVENGGAVELWQTELSISDPQILLEAVELGAVVVGNGQDILVLNIGTGQMIDSVTLDRELAARTFYTIMYGEPSINLAGFCHDTLYTYRLDLTDYNAISSGDDGVPEVPATFELVQNYPNPFNNGTQIQYNNEAVQYLTLTIFNVLGQEIVTLYEGITLVGEFSIEWSGRDEIGDIQPSGIYFAELRSGRQSQIIKLIYLK